MGCVNSTQDEKEAKQRSAAIDRQLRQSAKEYENTIKILLLGDSYSLYVHISYAFMYMFCMFTCTCFICLHVHVSCLHVHVSYVYMYTFHMFTCTHFIC